MENMAKGQQLMANRLSQRPKTRSKPNAPNTIDQRQTNNGKISIP